MRSPIISRLDELLADRATCGLDAMESVELESRLTDLVDFDEEAFDRLAAQLAIGWSPASESMPALLRERIVRDASSGGLRQRPKRRSRWIGLATAAAIVTIAILVIRDGSTRTTSPTPTLAERCAALETRAGTAVLQWTVRHEGYEGVVGAVVWNDDEQQGFMRLQGLAANDPAQSQYQLWIVDAKRDDHPVDGGVFDVTGDGAIVIAIDAKLAVSKPQAFAITLEKPGGVVVSTGPLLVVAPNGG